jgi:hypothetical protein
MRGPVYRFSPYDKRTLDERIALVTRRRIRRGPSFAILTTVKVVRGHVLHFFRRSKYVRRCACDREAQPIERTSVTQATGAPCRGRVAVQHTDCG